MHVETTGLSSSDGKETDVTARRGGGFNVGPAIASAALVPLVVAQLLWIALLVYGAYLAVGWLPF